MTLTNDGKAILVLVVLLMVVVTVLVASSFMHDVRQEFCEQFELDYDVNNNMCVCSGYGIQYGYYPPTENYKDLCE